MKLLMKADDEYRRLLKVLERDPDFDNEEIEMFKKTELISKCIELVKKNAKKRGKSPDDMELIESRLKKNFEIQRSLSPVGRKSRKASKKREDEGFTRAVGASPKRGGAKFDTSMLYTPVKKQAREPPKTAAKPIKKGDDDYNPFAITDLEMRRIK